MSCSSCSDVFKCFFVGAITVSVASKFCPGATICLLIGAIATKVFSPGFFQNDGLREELKEKGWKVEKRGYSNEFGDTYWDDGTVDVCLN